MEESEKIILNSLIENYEELQRIIRKTEYEIYVGELKSKLEKLNSTKTLYQAANFSPFLAVIPFDIFFSPQKIDSKISHLQVEILNAEKKIGIKYEILDQILHFLKLCTIENDITKIKEEAEAINIKIQKSILDTLESSLQYRIKTLESKLSKGRQYFAQMKDSQRKYDYIKKNLYLISEKNLNPTAADYEKLYDETVDAVYEADLSIKDSKYLRLATYSGLLLAIVGIVLAILPLFGFSLSLS